MAPVIWECERRNIPYFVLHTGQHYSHNMDRLFFRELGLPKPHYNLGLGGLSFRKQVGFFVKHIKKVLAKEKPDVVLVQGDTVSVIAGALAASKLGIPVAHHEAGLRSHDTSMLEEVNRTFVDHMSDFLFAPTKVASANLIAEGLSKTKVFLTGNTIVDVVRRHANDSGRRSGIMSRLGLEKKKYFLVTAHRAENVDNKERLRSIFEGLALVAEHFPAFDIIYPMHPRTAKKAEDFGLSMHKKVHVIEPVGYFDMLQLQQNARLIITDSGGIQEEACICKVPVVTIRDNTERPETVALGFNTLVPGVAPQAILAHTQEMFSRKYNWSNPFGDGKSGERIVDYLTRLV